MVPVEPSSLRSDLVEPTKDDPEMQRDTNNFNISINAGICPRKCAINVWHHHILAKQYFCKMKLWQNNTLAKWYFGKMILWQSNTLAKWHLGIHTVCFPNQHTVQSKRFCKLVHEKNANWMPEKPPIQRSLIFTGKTAARTSWSKRTTGSPNYLLLSLIFIYGYGCAVLFAAPRVVQDWVAFYHHGCRDAGTPLCMNMLWSHALPIRVFRVKTVQPSLNLSIFGHENHVSWSFYRFMLRDKRHCLQIEAWGWQHQLQTSQHHPSIRIAAQTHSTNAIWPQKHQLNW